MLVTAIYTLSIAFADPAVIQVKCDAHTNVAQNCYEEFKGALPNVFRSESEPDRAKTVGEAVRNCWNCASETLSNQMHDFGSNDRK